MNIKLWLNLTSADWLLLLTGILKFNLQSWFLFPCFYDLPYVHNKRNSTQTKYVWLSWPQRIHVYSMELTSKSADVVPLLHAIRSVHAMSISGQPAAAQSRVAPGHLAEAIWTLFYQVYQGYTLWSQPIEVNHCIAVISCLCAKQLGFFKIWFLRKLSRK